MNVNTMRSPNGLFALRSSQQNKGQLVNALEKLSSGYSINRSADDAAGLSVSEKMRAQITGYGQAIKNSQDSLRLLETGEGALEEIHSILNRLTELAEQSANGTYENLIDREALQKEMDKLSLEVDRIAQSTSFNGIKIFQDMGYEYENLTEATYIPSDVLDKLYLWQEADIMDDIRNKEQIQTTWGTSTQSATTSTQSAAETQQRFTLEEILANKGEDEINIVYIDEAEYDVTVTGGTTTTQATNVGTATDLVVDSSTGRRLSDILKEEIVPQTVKNILTQYSGAFGYLKNSNIGIGLRLYNDSSSSTLASVTCGGSTSSSGEGGQLDFTLSVNISTLSDIATNESTREDLEATIAHEMIHAFMFEATTNGMLTGQSDKFPSWFVEGMAQTAGGGMAWVSSALGKSGSNIVSAIQQKAKLADCDSTTTSTQGASRYATGYLACMYLGSVIAGGGTPSSTVDAATILSGLNTLLLEVISGTSLDSAIKNLTKGTFNSTAEFVQQFDSGQATNMQTFFDDLITATGNGRGGLASGDLTATDLADNASTTGINLFTLDTTTSTVANVYPSDYVVKSGGGTSSAGTQPNDYPNATPSTPADPLDPQGSTTPTNPTTPTQPTDPATPPTGPTVTTSDNVFTITGGVEGTDWSYDATNHTLTILSNTSLMISGGAGVSTSLLTADSTAAANGASNVSNIVVNNGIGNVTLFLNGVTCEADKALDLGTGNNVTLNLLNGTTNTMKSTDNNSAGISLGDKTNLTINGDTGELIATGTGAGAGIGRSYTQTSDMTSSITINGGHITATGGNDGGAGIGATKYTSIGDITINGGTIQAKALQHGAAIGGGWASTSHNGAITILGGNVTATSLYHGTGIGAGCQGTSGDILIGGDAIVNATGGDDASGIGASSSGNCGSITITGNANVTATGGNAGAGVGAGSNSAAGKNSVVGDIVIDTTGTVTASGGNNGAGIGASTQSIVNGSISISGSGTINATGGTNGSGIGVGSTGSTVQEISIDMDEQGSIVATGGDNGAGIGAGYNGSSVNSISITGSGTINAVGGDNGAGIGVGANGSSVSSISIAGSGTINAQGGANGAAIGAGANESTVNGNITIEGDVTVSAIGGENGAGIGAGANKSVVQDIIINTNGSVTTSSGKNGVGIGSGNGDTVSASSDDDMSQCGDIWIKKGTVTATGPDDSTGIGAGRGSICGDITIGDTANPMNRVVVTATGGLTENGGNIVAYTNSAHTESGTLVITGQNTSVCAGAGVGEGLYSTTIAVDENGRTIYGYPLHLFAGGLSTDEQEINATKGILNLPIPSDVSDLTITATGKDGTVISWSPDISHSPLDSNNIYVWMTGQNQTLDISFTFRNRARNVSLNLIFYPEAGVFRTIEQDVPEAAKLPSYKTGGDYQGVLRTAEDFDPILYAHDPITEHPLRFQIGAESSDILYVPKFFLSSYSLGLETLDLATQEDASQSMDVVKNAINRISDIRGAFGALSNRLEHNINNLRTSNENITEAESRIRDVDVAKEAMKYAKYSILSQSADFMIAACNQNAGMVLQLLQ